VKWQGSEVELKEVLEKVFGKNSSFGDQKKRKGERESIQRQKQNSEKKTEWGRRLVGHRVAGVECPFR